MNGLFVPKDVGNLEKLLEPRPDRDVIVFSRENKIYWADHPCAPENYICKRRYRVSALGVHGDQLYDASGGYYLHKTEFEKPFDVDFAEPLGKILWRIDALHSFEGELLGGCEHLLFCNYGDTVKVRRKNHECYALQEYNSRLYQGFSKDGSNWIYDDFGEDPYDRRSGRIRSFAIHDGKLLDCGDYMGVIINTMTGDIEFNLSHKEELVSMFSFDSTLYALNVDGDLINCERDSLVTNYSPDCFAMTTISKEFLGGVR